MTSISANSLSTQRLSPLAMLQKTLAAEVSSGKIKSSDENALSSALDTIDSAMRASRQSGPPSPEEGKAKVESMIDDMVSKGTLTSEQAEELKSVFEDTFAGGPGGAKGKMGPPPPPPSDEDSEEDSSSTSISLTVSGSSSDIASLLQKLLESLASNGSSTYSSSAKTSSNVSSLFVDKAA